jgi:CheY-like chemotaxis protein
MRVTDANILLVDDDAQFIDIMKKRLTMRSMEVFHAGSGEEAMQKLAAHGEIEVVILDVKLPGKSGIEMLQLIKQQYPLVEVIMLTGTRHRGIGHRRHAAGGFGLSDEALRHRGAGREGQGSGGQEAQA